MEHFSGMGNPSAGTAPRLPSEPGTSEADKAAAPALVVTFLSAY